MHKELSGQKEALLSFVRKRVHKTQVRVFFFVQGLSFMEGWLGIAGSGNTVLPEQVYTELRERGAAQKRGEEGKC